MNDRPTTHEERQALYTAYKLRNRNRYEVADYLDMIARQGAEIEHRRMRLIAAYAADDERRRLDTEPENSPPRLLPVKPECAKIVYGDEPPATKGTLEERIAALTEIMMGRKSP